MSLYDDVLGAPDTASRKSALDALIAEKKNIDAEKVRTFPIVTNEGIQSFREHLERAIRDQD